ncbi:PAXBP1 family protein [Megaselia abdita]
MSMFRKPKKPMLRKVFADTDERMDTEEETNSRHRDRDKDRHRSDREKSKPKVVSSSSSSSTAVVSSGSGLEKKHKALLSFDDDEEGEVFQVKKSSHSKKVSRMLDKERRKKAKEEKNHERNRNGDHRQDKDRMDDDPDGKSQKADNIQTEIRTDDFVLVVKKSEPDLILNGRAALCAGRDDMSDEEEQDEADLNHRFSKPENLRKFLESGSIPDAAMINAARLARNKKRIQGEIIPLEEKKPDLKVDKKKGSRLVREEDAGDDEVSDDERVDMNAISGAKEREERRDQFYAAENDYSDDDSDRELKEWENQQIRKGVTGAQLVVAQSESVLSRFVIKPSQGQIEYPETEVSTSRLLERAYAESALENPKVLHSKSKKAEKQTTRSVEDIRAQIKGRINKLKELNRKHFDDVDKISMEMKDLDMEGKQAADQAPKAAKKFKFYQEIRGYTKDFEECMNVKVPVIEDLETQALGILSKHATFLIERRRQDIRDQAKEMAEATKPSSIKKTIESEEVIRRAAEREGRRTRRRCDRERNNTLCSHLDGMSSDEEVSDQDMSLYRNAIEQLRTEIKDLFSDAAEEFYDANEILKTFYSLKVEDPDTYKDAFINICLPKVSFLEITKAIPYNLKIFHSFLVLRFGRN